MSTSRGGKDIAKNFKKGENTNTKGGNPYWKSSCCGGWGRGEASPEINLNIAPLAQLKLIVMARALQPYKIIPMISIMVIEQLKHQTKKCAK